MQHDYYIGPDGHVKENAMLINGEKVRQTLVATTS